MKNTKKIKLILFALCFATFFILFSGTSKVNAAVIMKVVNTNYLYARKSNSQNSDSHGHFKDGDLVEVVKCSSTWAKISKETLVRNDAGIFTLSFATACMFYIIATYSGRTYQVTETKKEFGDNDFIFPSL